MLKYKDIPGKNEMNPGELLLAEKTVSYCGQPVAVVIAGESSILNIMRITRLSSFIPIFGSLVTVEKNLRRTGELDCPLILLNRHTVMIHKTSTQHWRNFLSLRGEGDEPPIIPSAAIGATWH